MRDLKFRNEQFVDRIRAASRATDWRELIEEWRLEYLYDSTGKQNPTKQKAWCICGQPIRYVYRASNVVTGCTFPVVDEPFPVGDLDREYRHYYEGVGDTCLAQLTGFPAGVSNSLLAVMSAPDRRMTKKGVEIAVACNVFDEDEAYQYLSVPAGKNPRSVDRDEVSFRTDLNLRVIELFPFMREIYRQQGLTEDEIPELDDELLWKSRKRRSRKRAWRKRRKRLLRQAYQ